MLIHCLTSAMPKATSMGWLNLDGHDECIHCLKIHIRIFTHAGHCWTHFFTAQIQHCIPSYHFIHNMDTIEYSKKVSSTSSYTCTHTRSCSTVDLTQISSNTHLCIHIICSISIATHKLKAHSHIPHVVKLPC